MKRRRATSHEATSELHAAAPPPPKRASSSHGNGVTAAPPLSAPADADVVASTILRLTQSRSGGGTVCPSEVARALFKPEAAWRAAMPLVRAVAAGLVAAGAAPAPPAPALAAAAGRLVVTQRGVVVDVATAKGPVRLKWVPPGG